MDGWGVEDGLFSWLAHNFLLSHLVWDVQGVRDGQSASVTVTEQLETLPQIQRAPDHAQHRFRNRNWEKKNNKKVARHCQGNVVKDGQFAPMLCHVKRL